MELPHDWEVIKRPGNNHQGKEMDPPPNPTKNENEISAVDETEAPENDETKEDSDEIKEQQDSASSCTKRKEPASSQTPNLKLKISKSPLGPKGVFNAVMQDRPEKGQLKQMILAHLSSSTGCDGKNSREMDVHCLITKVPYQKMLSDLLINHDKEILPSPNIPYVTRAYEESYMRERLHSSERLCAKNEHCECMFLDPENPFICIEFLLPGEKPPTTPHLCVVCCRSIFLS